MKTATSVKQMLKDLEDRKEILTDWEINFVESLHTWDSYTVKQIDKITALWKEATTEKPIVRTGSPLRLHIPEINFILDSLKCLEGVYNPDDAEDKNSALYYSRKLQAKIKHQLENPR